jgi:hypothetical protein
MNKQKLTNAEKEERRVGYRTGGNANSPKKLA